MLYEATYYCYETAEGWGRIGAVQTIGRIHADNMEEAAREARFICPGNWRAICIREMIDYHDELFDAKGG